ncbi:hypothetical protein L1987_59882 [Smallanthus sonchifolius]|uniref:Uncharacterized protein n=1 Tax=Smallanthus sonchifolius TaxID=185202 RepID=A0ACB9D6J4_9ASTR|nr:hypothetical protein L1987_59882 [Smallanthus sonchifolius]
MLRNAKEAKTEKGDRPTKTSTLTEKKIICFDEGDRDNVQDPHHDGLVITLYIANHFIHRILIDGGSSVNIIQLEVLKRMGIPDSEIISKSSVLVGFSGEEDHGYTTCGQYPQHITNVSRCRPLGVIKINSDQQEAKDNNTSSMKASTKTRQA